MSMSTEVRRFVDGFVRHYCQWDKRDDDEKALLILGTLTEKIILNGDTPLTEGALLTEIQELRRLAQAFVAENPHGWKDVCLYAYGDGVGIKDALYGFVNWLSTEKASSVCCAVGEQLLSFKPLGVADTESLVDEFLDQ